MTKLEFISNLHDKLSGLPRTEIEERITFYTEMIDDRMEEGLREEDAVAAVGSVDEIAAQIRTDYSYATPKKERTKSKGKRKAWEIVLLVLGSPIWLSLVISAFAVAISLYASLWAVIISLWAVFVSVAACAFAGIVSGVFFAISGHIPSGVALIGASFVCAGLSIFLFYGCKAATTGTLHLTKALINKAFAKKEDVS